MNDSTGVVARRRMTIEGVVQGVGFRPHVHRLATARGLVGHVGNDSASVFVEVEGAPADVAWFEARVVADAPPLARIVAVTAVDLPSSGGSTFEIVESRPVDGARTFVPPDVAVCDDCVAELLDPADHRYRYPFITCTNCGPRFTIIDRLPYDRPNTTMAGFVLCAVCAGQYHDPADRRFHAQPLACAACGPSIAYESAEERVHGTDEVIVSVHGDLAAGLIVAIKGLGGYHLACDATNDGAVARLRERKGRIDKPFAVMVADVARARTLADFDDVEEAALTSGARPIVLVRSRPAILSPLVAPRNPRVGLMLPYTPLHHLLFAPVPGRDRVAPVALVMTSGNLSDEPLAYDDDDARRRLAGLADSFCTHDRPIHVPCDDSVLRIVDGCELPIRRSRGYAPLPVRLPAAVGPTLAVGGELKNTFCLADGRDAWMSQHIGDMGNLETLAAFERSVALFTDMYAIEPHTIAADAHPGYATRRWAEDRAGSNPEPRSDDLLTVQHHHAHVCALMAEAGVVDEPILGVAFDGTGYGLDGAIWGGEFLVADYAGFDRVAALADVPLPGGDAAIRKPYRTALAHLWAAGIGWSDDLPPVRACPAAERRALSSMLDSNVGCVPTTSMGRLFDAVSALLGVRHEITYEGQAAIELEHLAADARSDGPVIRFPIGDDGRIAIGDVLSALVEHLRSGTAIEALAAAFHDAVAELVVAVARQVRTRSRLETIGLTGGVFQNALLVESTSARLRDEGFTVLTHRLVPPNDGGLALGQVIAAAHRPAD